MRSEEHFVFFLVYEVTTLKVTIEFPAIFLLFGRKSTDHFAEQFPVLEPTKPSAVIFQPRCLFIRSSHVSHEWNHKSDGEFFSEKAKKSQSNATVAGFRSTKINTQEYSNLKKHLTEFWGLKEQALQFGIGGFSLMLFRLAKSSTGKCENFALITDGQWQLELPNLISDEGSSELNCKS